MPDTTNFGWSKPTVGGDNNAWGQKLNDLFDAQDADLQTLADAVEALETDNTTNQTNITTLQALAASARVKCITPSGTNPVNWTAESYDTAAMHDNASNNNRITIPAGFTGAVHLEAVVRMVGGGLTSGGTGTVSIRKNGTTVVQAQASPGNSTDTQYATVAYTDLPAEGDFYDVTASGSNVTFTPLYFAAHRLP